MVLALRSLNALVRYQQDSDVEDCHLIPQWCHVAAFGFVSFFWVGDTKDDKQIKQRDIMSIATSLYHGTL